MHVLEIKAKTADLGKEKMKTFTTTQNEHNEVSLFLVKNGKTI